MSALFADTFFYLALVSRDSKARERATRVARRWSGRVVTTAWVVTEVANALTDPPHRALCTNMITALRSDPATKIIPASAALFELGWGLYTSRPDQSWSLTDCISFVVMKQERLTDALTGDHHFEQAGFHALLKPRD